TEASPGSIRSSALLVLRAAPTRARLAGLLAGAGTGFLAEGVYHLDCPITHLSHVLVWHGSAILLLALLGFGFGLGVEARERARMERRRAEAAPREGGVR
ncbi:MAG TPA: NrsF family protein, partial [Thermoanaerobaculia bacterium]|nr:NrsF family protein [Thermoanaerobaculia bacterium]